MSVLGDFLPPDTPLSEETIVGRFAQQWAVLKRGESMVYHTGFLARDREDDFEVDELARLTLTLALPRGTHQNRCLDLGLDHPPMGVASLSQRKLDKGVYEYVITKRVTRAVLREGHVIREALA